MAIDYAKYAEKYKWSSETYGDTWITKYEYYSKRAAQDKPTTTTTKTTTTATPVKNDAISKQQKQVDYWKWEIDKQTNVPWMEERIKESRSQYKRAQESLWKLQQEQKGIDSSKFLTEKDIYEKTPKEIEQQVKEQSPESKDFDLVESLKDKEARIRDMAMDPSRPPEERKRLTEQADKYLDDMKRYEEDITLKQRTEERKEENKETDKYKTPEDKKNEIIEDFKQQLEESERNKKELEMELKNKYALDLEKHKEEQDARLRELEEKALWDIQKRQTELQKLLLDEGSLSVWQRPDIMQNKIEEILNTIKTEQSTFTDQLKDTQAMIQKLFDDADEDTQLVIDEYTPKIEEARTELNEIQEKIDEMDAADLEIANDVLKEVAGEAPQSYINALIAKRQKETLWERYLLETKYARIQDDLQFYQNQLTTRKEEIRQDRNDRYTVVQSNLSFLQNQQQFAFSSQMQQLGIAIEEDRYQQQQALQERQFKVNTMLSIGELETRKTEMQLAFEKDRLSREFQEKQLMLDQDYKQLQAQIQIAQLPVWTEIKYGGNTFYGMKEDDNINVIKTTDANGNIRLIWLNKKTGEALYDTKAGVDYEAQASAWEKNFKSEQDLRKEFSTNQIVKEFNTVNSAYNRISASVEEVSAAWDLSLIFNYMKVLDPNSVVRESEFATAENAPWVNEKTRNFFNKLLTGKRFGEEITLEDIAWGEAAGIRNDFVNTAKRLYEWNKQQYEAIKTQYENIADNYWLDKDMIILPFWQTIEGGKVKSPTPATKNGQTYYSVNGSNYTSTELKNIQRDIPWFTAQYGTKLNNPSGLKVTSSKNKVFNAMGINYTTWWQVPSNETWEYYIFNTIPDFLDSVNAVWASDTFLGNKELWWGLMNWVSGSYANNPREKELNYRNDVLRNAFGNNYQWYMNKTFKDLTENEKTALILWQLKRENVNVFNNYINSLK